MQLSPRQQLMQFAHTLQAALLPALEPELGPMGSRAQLLVQVLALVPLGLWQYRRRLGRPAQDRLALTAAFLAKAVYGLASTRQLMDQLRVDQQMRRLCGWLRPDQIPHESTFSRAFAEFAGSALPQKLHEALIAATQSQRLIGHISRDSTAIAARERFADPPAPRKKRKLKKPKRAKAIDRGTQIERQRHQSLDRMLADLHTGCSLGVKKSSKGHQHYWRGYKLHLDVADGQIPISAILTGAKVHDCNVAIPLMTMSSRRITWLYDLMDSAYDADAILAHSCSLQHVPIVDPHPRRNGRSQSILPKVFPPKRAPELTWAQRDRFRERSTVERVFSRLKDEFTASAIRVRGPHKVMAHLCFALIALTVDQLIKLTG